MRILFLGGHTDEELCFGGTILKCKEAGHEVDYTVFSFGSAQLNEFDESTKILGCDFVDIEHLFKIPYQAQQIADLIFRIKDKYDLVFTHSPLDRHPLHRMIAEETIRVINGDLLTYMGCWNGEENANYFVEITEEQLETKIRALACYKSQAHRTYMQPDFIRAQARYNGMRCGKLYAEGFKVVRLVQ